MLNSNILITGASGYIGSYAYFFLKEKYKLHVVDKKLNNDNFEFIFAVISNSTGKLTKIDTSSDIYRLTSKRNVLKYTYQVMTLKLDDFCSNNNIYPTHLKIDTDGQEFGALNGTENNLKGSVLKEIFIEIINEDCLKVTDYIKSFGFKVVWHNKKTQNQEFIFKR